MNVFDVHVNRIPISGKITWLKYVPGTFLNASLDKSSENNERMIAKIEVSKEFLFMSSKLQDLLQEELSAN